MTNNSDILPVRLSHFLSLCILIELMSVPLWAQGGFNYVHHNEPFNRSFEILALNHRFMEQGFHPLSIRSAGQITYIPVDQIYQRNDQRLYLKLGISPTNRSPLNKITKIEPGYIYHSTTESSVPYAVLAENMTPTDLEKIFRGKTQTQIEPETQTEARVECPTCTPKENHLNTVDSIQNLAATTTAATPNPPLSCAMSALGVAREQIVSIPKNLLQEARLLISSPTKFWGETVHRTKEVAQAATEVNRHLSQFFKTLKNLDPTFAKELSCQLTGSLITLAALSAGGFATAKVSITAIKAIKSLSALIPLLNAASAIPRLRPEALAWTRLALTCGSGAL